MGHTLSATTPFKSLKDMSELCLESIQLVESFKYEVRGFHPTFLEIAVKANKMKKKVFTRKITSENSVFSILVNSVK